MQYSFLCTVLGAACLAVGVVAQTFDDRIYKDKDGLIRVKPYPIDAKYLNEAWPDSEEKDFWSRANNNIKDLAAQSNTCNTFFENEKSAYPKYMAQFLAGNRNSALNCFHQKDNTANTDHKHTMGIDYFACFTLKGQMRKYFWFGKFGGYLRPGYLDTMSQGGKLWTAQDPITTPHPIYGEGNGEYGYTPTNRGYQVDRRMTDNLRGMREGSIYLMAEETGNETIRLLYKQKILSYTAQLYHIGMGEWDSENYFGHTMSAYLNVYDFAQDHEVKMAAKAVLDWISAAAALKYFRGGYGGPMSRDYAGGNQVFGSLVSHPLWLYFGDSPISDPNAHYDDIHHAMSAYRPPQAVVALARKQFTRPVEILSAKPPYQTWVAGADSAPAYHETLFFGRTFHMGSVVSKNDGSPYDIGPFKILMENSQRGADYFVPFADRQEVRYSIKKPGDQIAQFENLMIWMRPSELPLSFQYPKTAKVTKEDGLWFLEYEKTWLAIRPINMSSLDTIAYVAKDTLYRKLKTGKYTTEQFARGKTTGSGIIGFALEVGEAPDYADYAAFQQAVRSKNKVEVTGTKKDAAELTGSNGKTVKLTFNYTDDVPGVARNGKAVDWSAWRDLHQPQGQSGPISLGSKKGFLQVAAGGKTFTQGVAADGKVTSTPPSVGLERWSPAMAKEHAGLKAFQIEDRIALSYSGAVFNKIALRNMQGRVLAVATGDLGPNPVITLKEQVSGLHLIVVQTSSGSSSKRFLLW